MEMAPLGGSGDGGVAIEAIMTRWWTSMWRRKRIPKRDHRMTLSGKGEDEIQYARAAGKAAAGIRTSEAALEASSGGSSTAAVDRALDSASAVDAVAVAAEAASGSGDRPTAASRGSARTFDWPGLTSQVPRPPPPRPQDVRPHGTEQQCGRLQSQGHQQNPQQGAVLVAAATGDGWCRRDPSFDDDPK